MFFHNPIVVFLTMIVATQGRATSSCENCPYALITPICGSNGYLYYNECHMRQASCWLGVNITQAPWGECTPETCSPICTLEYTAVCGEDGKIYHGNRCTFLWESCGRATPLNEAPLTTCPEHTSLWGYIPPPEEEE